MISICRNRSANVKNWQNGNMALRWCAAGLGEADKQFRRVNGHMHLPTLRTALQRHVAEQTVSADRHDERERSLMIIGPPPEFHGTRDILTPAVNHS
jgi:putative transposase